MSAVFADTSYYVALLLRTDNRHEQAVALTAGHSGVVVTTEWVLAELGNFLSPPHLRRYFADLVSDLRNEPGMVIVSASPKGFAAALSLYRDRSDQSWSFTDCASFAEMTARGISHAWTTDHHFEQAGFRALLK